MFGLSRGPAALLLLAVVLVATACGTDPPATPSRSPQGSGGPSASGSGLTGSGAPSASPSGPVAPTAVTFWQAAAKALSRSGRLRLVMSGNGIRELRYEPKASGVIADGSLASVCATGAAWTVQGLNSTTVPGKWACGGSALVSSFRKSGQPVYAWNSRLPVDTKIREVVSAPTRDHWQWAYTGTSKLLGAVKTTLTLDSTTGRLLSGSRTDKTGTTRYTFSYTTIFAPIALP